MCEGCHEKIVDSLKPVCPTCRARLNKDKPNRNRFAETILSNHIVACSNEGCETKLKFANLKVHSTAECGYRKVLCKFHPLGCEWNALFKDKRPHEKDCPIRKNSIKGVLKNVQERNKQQESKENKIREQNSAYKEVAILLSRRCRDLVFRDVILEKDVVSSEMCSKTFSALNAMWELVLVPRKPDETKTDGTTSSSSPQRVAVFLRAVCPIKKQLSFSLMVLPGPDLSSDSGLMPSVHRTRIKRSRRNSVTPPLVLPFDKDQVDRVYEMSQINLRIGIIDFSSHRPHSSFLVGRGSSSASDSDTESMYSDVDDGLDIELSGIVSPPPPSHTHTHARIIYLL